MSTGTNSGWWVSLQTSKLPSSEGDQADEKRSLGKPLTVGRGSRCPLGSEHWIAEGGRTGLSPVWGTNSKIAPKVPTPGTQALCVISPGEWVTPMNVTGCDEVML